MSRIPYTTLELSKLTRDITDTVIRSHYEHMSDDDFSALAELNHQPTHSLFDRIVYARWLKVITASPTLNSTVLDISVHVCITLAANQNVPPMQIPRMLYASLDTGLAEDAVDHTVLSQHWVAVCMLSIAVNFINQPWVNDLRRSKRFMETSKEVT